MTSAAVRPMSPAMAGTEYASHAPTLVTVPLLIGLLLFVSVVVGHRVVRALRVGPASTAGERLVIYAATGIGLLQFVPFALGVCGVLSTTSVRIAIAVIAAVCLLDVGPVLAATRRWFAQRRRLAAWEWFWLALLALPLVFSVLIALAPSYDPDGVGYHLAAPKQWLEMGSLGFLPTLTYTSGPMGTEMLYAIALPIVGDAGAKSLHFMAAILAAGGVFLIGKRVAGAMVGRLASTLFLFGPLGIISVIGLGYAEATATLAVVGSTLCWVIWFRSGDRGWLRVAALLAGTAVSFKLTAIVFPVALTVLTVLIVRRVGRRETGMVDARSRTIAGLFALVVAPMVPWLIRSLVVSGNPVFPVLARWIPSRDFPPEMARQFEEYNRYMVWGSRWGDELSIDARRAIIGVVGLIVVAVGTLVFLRLRDPVARAVAIVVIGTVLVQVVAAGLYTRYWTPLAAVIQIPVIALVVSRLDRWDRRIASVGLFALTFLLIAGDVRSGLRDEPGEFVAAAVDAGERDELLDQRFPLVPLVRLASEDAGPGEAVLMTDICGAFYVDGPAMCTGFSDSLRMSSWDDFIHDIDELGITRVMAPTVLEAGGRPPGANGAGSVSVLMIEDTYDMIARLIQERGEQIGPTVDGWGVYRIAPATTE